MCGYIFISVMSTKICSYCKEEKSLNLFYFRKNRNRYESRCNPCCAKITQEKRKNPEEKEKVRKACKKWREKNINKQKEMKKEYYSKNKDIIKINRHKYYLNNQDKFKQSAHENREKIKQLVQEGKLQKPNITHKICTKCNMEKDISNFTFRKFRNIYEAQCKKCKAEQEKLRRILKHDEIRIKAKENYKPPPSQRRIAINLRKRTNRYVTNRNGKNLYLKLLGCNKQFLIKWFEFHFQMDEHFNMNWDNYGQHWHIDHVKPCCSFDMTNDDEQKECFHWTNICPVLKDYNLLKGGQIKLLDQIRQEIRVKKFIKEIGDKTQHLIYSMLLP